MTSLVLASQSPARLATLRGAGVDPVVIVSGVDESQLDGLPPAELALQLAELKCAADSADPVGGLSKRSRQHLARAVAVIPFREADRHRHLKVHEV